MELRKVDEVVGASSGVVVTLKLFFILYEYLCVIFSFAMGIRR